MLGRRIGASIAGTLVSLALVGGACSGADGTPPVGADALQSQCVIDQLDLERYIPDWHVCDNFGYSDCIGWGSECANYCAFGFCQPKECASPEDCIAGYGELPLGVKWVCEPYVLSSKTYGTWCDFVEDCVEGTVNCPCLEGEVCGPDLWGDGNMRCVNGYCESQCPRACIAGSVCCGGSLCSGDCIGTPCCS